MHDEAISLAVDRTLSGCGDLQCSDGVPMETPWHRDTTNLLIETARQALEGRDVVIGGNEFIYFSRHQIKKNDFCGPDFYLVVDVSPHQRKYWASWEEGGRLPDVVVELTSESTAHIDRGKKKKIYDEVWGVQAYYMFDPDGFRLEGYTRGPTGLEPLPMGDDGGIECPFLNLRLVPWTGPYMGVTTTYLRWFRPDGSMILTDGEEARDRLEGANEKLEDANERLEDALDRVAALEAQLRALRGD